MAPHARSPRRRRRPAPKSAASDRVSDRLEHITRVLGSDAAVADVRDVSRAQPRRWREGQVPDPGNRDRIIGLADVIAAIEAQKAGVHA